MGFLAHVCQTLITTTSSVSWAGAGAGETQLLSFQSSYPAEGPGKSWRRSWLNYFREHQVLQRKNKKQSGIKRVMEGGDWGGPICVRKWLMGKMTELLSAHRDWTETTTATTNKNEWTKPSWAVISDQKENREAFFQLSSVMMISFKSAQSWCWICSQPHWTDPWLHPSLYCGIITLFST